MKSADEMIRWIEKYGHDCCVRRVITLNKAAERLLWELADREIEADLIPRICDAIHPGPRAYFLARLEEIAKHGFEWRDIPVPMTPHPERWLAEGLKAGRVTGDCARKIEALITNWAAKLLEYINGPGGANWLQSIEHDEETTAGSADKPIDSPLDE